MQVAAGHASSSASQVDKSTPSHRVNRPIDFPHPIPLPAHRSEPAGGGISFQNPQSVMPHFASQGSHRVVPPIGPLSKDLVSDGTQVHMEEEISDAAAMESGTYFTNLMSNGLSVPYFPPMNPHDTPLADDIRAKGTHERSKNFSVDEDTLLVSAWLNVSLDPIQGVDQSHSTYWKRVYDYFHVNKTFDSDRTQGSLMNRWSGIQHDVNLFACVSPGLRLETKGVRLLSTRSRVHVLCLRVRTRFTGIFSLCIAGRY